MLFQFPDRACVFAAVDYDLVPFGRVQLATDAVLPLIKPKGITVSPIHGLFRLPDRHCLFTIGVKRISWQLLGLSHWKTHLDEYLDISLLALDKLEVRQFSRVGFKVMVFLPIGMTHAEMSQLMFGSFLADREDLTHVFDQVEDPLVQLHGKRADLDYALTLTAMTKADITTTFRQIPNIDSFLEDRHLDDSLRTFHDRISTNEVFFFDVDFSQTDVPAPKLSAFLSSAMSEADSLSTACVHRLQTKPLKK
jgi:hypothetical protein